MTAKIALKQLTKSFGDNQVLDGVDLEVAKGESLVILGGSGTGKSVMLKCILGLLPPNAGQILIDGQDCVDLTGSALDQHRRRFGMLFQGAALFDSLPVWRNIIFALDQNGAAPGLRDKAITLLGQVGLDADVANLMPASLSGGMQKRVALARAIAAEPEIIFFDEPTTGLDPIRADVINDLIVKLVKELGVTAMTITHDIASARKIADRIALLHEGKILWEGPRARMDDSGNPYVDQFVHGRAHGPITVGKGVI